MLMTTYGNVIDDSARRGLDEMEEDHGDVMDGPLRSGVRRTWMGGTGLSAQYVRRQPGLRNWGSSENSSLGVLLRATARHCLPGRECMSFAPLALLRTGKQYR